MQRGESHKSYKRASIKAYILLQGLRQMQLESAHRIYVPSGWKHYARDRKALRRTFVSWGKTVVFFDRREKKQFFQGKQMFFSEFFCARHNFFQPEGYIFLGFHPLTYHKPLHFDEFCFILPLQILLISWPIGRPCPGGAGDPKGAAPLWPQCVDF